MPHISNFRLLFSSSTSSPLRPLTTLLPSNLRRHCSVFSPLRSSSSPGSRRDSYSPSFTRRGESTFVDRDRHSKGLPMDETKSLGFNKKRAEGRDGNGLPKKELQLKKRPRANPVSTISYVQILGTGMDTQDTSPSVLLFFDHQRFIFNAGEGLQRFCTQHKIKLSKIDHIFLSRVCSETAGGLPGLLLTLAAMGEEGMSVNIWGPSDLKYLIDAMKSFIPNAAMVHTKSFGPTSGRAAMNTELDQFKDPVIILEDDVVKISAVLLWPRELVRGESPIGCVDVSSSILEGENRNAFGLKPGDMSVVYICELPEIKGRFHPERAKEKGINPGPEYRELQLGNSVFSKNLNIMVHPSDVMDPSIPGPVVLIVDCPTKSHFWRLSSLDSLSNYYSVLSSEESQKNVSCMIHLSPSSIISDPDYQTWMKRFGSAQHVIAGHEMKNAEIPILSASARISARLNYLCPQFFPAPGFWSSKQSGLSLDSSFSYKDISDPRKITSAENLLKFNLRPRDKIGLDRSIIPNTLTASKTIDELLTEIPEIAEAAENVRNLWDPNRKGEEENNTLQEEPWLNENKLPNCLENIRRDDLEIVLLGTGSSQPSKYRNVSSIYVNLFSKGGLLLDCGEGTLGQMKRRFGIEGADNALRGLSCIWISHIHADHHAGLARILAQRRDLLKGLPHDPLLVVGPRQLKRYLDAYRRLEDLDMLFLDCRHTTESSLSAFEEFLQSPDSEMPSPPRSPSTQQGLFTLGSPMQSCWKRPGVSPDISMAFPILKSMKKVLREAGLDSLVSFPVVHCPQAYGVVLKASQRVNGRGKLIEGWKVVYSGDTRPCPELTEASRGATVLINEATFEDGMVDEAIARNHSTTEEAIQVGAAAGVYRIILTHFSQRYPKIPVFGESHMHKTCIAFDLMSINIADLPVLPRVLPYLKLLFKNEMAGDESEDVLEESVGVTY
ncbi:hypothetical protein SAY87_018221 [Trapa incisa]|uniref:ribonuclease Z n=1 Tax=Trapa incisa TaxID=236973 RepID=A0AAN7L5N5_9MYRT|nr:hypothetical protein SAY87_018221 [Trapa incisa]